MTDAYSNSPPAKEDLLKYNKLPLYVRFREKLKKLSFSPTRAFADFDISQTNRAYPYHRAATLWKDYRLVIF